MKFLKTKNQAGFTIIEVMIVLAIAGVIMLALFLAVPALQRNSRNNQRQGDAALVASSVNECLNARNGQVTSCDERDEITPNFLDTTKLRQLTDFDISDAAPTAPADTTLMNVGYRARCSTDGASVENGTTRQFVVFFNNESTTGGNVSRCLEG